jgi:hypothetical protein
MKKASQLKGKKQILKKLFFSVALITVLIAVFMVLPAYAEGENLVKNPGFEDVSGTLPSNWRNESYLQDAGVTKISIEGNAHTGSNCIAIENIKDNDAKLVQDVKLELGKLYKISYWVKAENFAPGSVAGGNLTIMNGIFETQQNIDTKGQWKKVEAYTKTRSTGSDIMNVALRVGGFGTVVKGKAYFDDVSIELVESLPAGAQAIDFFVPDAPKSGGSKDGAKGGIAKPVIIVVIIVVVVGLLVFVEVKFAKRGNKSGEDAESKEDNLEGEDDEYEDDE